LEGDLKEQARPAPWAIYYSRRAAGPGRTGAGSLRISARAPSLARRDTSATTTCARIPKAPQQAQDDPHLLTHEFGVAAGDRHPEPEGFPAISRLARKAVEWWSGGGVVGLRVVEM